MSQLILTDRIRVINLVPQNHERDLAQLLHTQQSVELGFWFRETFVVFGVNEEYDAGDFWEIVLPETACWSMSAKPYHGEKLEQIISYLVDVHPNRKSWIWHCQWQVLQMLESCQYMRTCLRLPAHLLESNSLGWRVGWRIATLSFCTNLNISKCFIPFKYNASLLSKPRISRIVNRSISTHLQHMQQRGLSRIVETEEQKFCMFVQEAQRCESIPNYWTDNHQLDIQSTSPIPGVAKELLTPVNDPHLGYVSTGWRF
jgi:hypothetical protein